MSTLLYGMQRDPIPSGDNEVRTTVTVVDANAPSATQEHVTDWNETFTDPDTEGGLTSRQEASHVRPSERYVPHIADVTYSTNKIINEQVSSSGVAAAKEARGEWGHGTIKIVEGIEPAIRDGAALGADYFVTNPRQQAHAGNYMTPAQAAAPDSVAEDGATGKANARAAYDGSMYAAFHAARMGEQ